VSAIDAREVGLACMSLGAGRTRADEDVDPAVGAILHAKVGDRVEKGAKLATLHVRDASQARTAAPRISDAYALGAKRARAPKLILETIRA
jgi:pyrimidine-nucleoside phosphorylase